jgi:lariat debranching enzyme
LIKKKPFFKEDLKRGQLGASCLDAVLYKIKPSHWFSAHLHVKFESKVKHRADDYLTNFSALSKPKPGKPNGFKSDPYFTIR